MFPAMFHPSESVHEPLLLDNDALELHALDDDASLARNASDEKALVRRLDRRLMVFAMLGNMIKTMDNVNLANAYISGMEEELAMKGVMYNWVSVYFMVGYVLMQIPSNMILVRVRPSRYLPLLESIWCALTLLTACVQSVRALYVLRFLLGLAEAGFYPGLVFLIGTWYSKKELGKRNALITICGSLGAAMSGIVQAILLKTLDGTFNISGWRWMFALDGTATAVLAWYGLAYLPDYPENTSWLTKQELALTKLRRGATEVGASEPTRAISRTVQHTIKSLVTNKYIFLFVIAWVCLNLGLGASHVLGIVAKKVGYSAVTANLLGTPDMAVTVAVGLCNGFLSDAYQTRLWCILVPAGFAFVGCCLLAAFVQPFGLLYTGFLLTHAGLAGAAPVVMSWASETLTQTASIKAISLAIMNTSSALMYTWTPLVLWPVTDAPYYKTGFICSIGFIGVLMSSVVVIGVFRNRDTASTSRLGLNLPVDESVSDTLTDAEAVQDDNVQGRT